MRLWAALVAVAALFVAMWPGGFCLCDAGRCAANDLGAAPAPVPLDDCGDDDCGRGGGEDAEPGCAPSCAFACLRLLTAVEATSEPIRDDGTPSLAPLPSQPSLESLRGSDFFHPPRR